MTDPPSPGVHHLAQAHATRRRRQRVLVVTSIVILLLGAVPAVVVAQRALTWSTLVVLLLSLAIIAALDALARRGRSGDDPDHALRFPAVLAMSAFPRQLLRNDGQLVSNYIGGLRCMCYALDEGLAVALFGSLERGAAEVLLLRYRDVEAVRLDVVRGRRSLLVDVSTGETLALGLPRRWGPRRTARLAERLQRLAWAARVSAPQRPGES